jgi:predicted DCC family thiol-disulfide oxidoreductase YuxK
MLPLEVPRMPEPSPPAAPGFRRAAGARLVVYYDESCGPCRRTARLLDAVNWLGWVRFCEARQHPTAQGEQYADILSTRRDGTPYAGFATYQQIAWRIPLLWWLLPIVYLPPVVWVGRRIYRRIADRRRCLIEKAREGSAGLGSSPRGTG